ncbi:MULTISPECIES: ferritin-like domain-containing protein [unclassified Microcoleus]|uniref:ferritin-like domain-containing protein n=1 Tax=unclassified Microcoleus TaxID=2642155 RepID=UPI002FD5FAD0
MAEENNTAKKIFPRNLTARAAYQVAGNPVTTRLESGVGNCYPGLEMHVPALDRRFFPGLLFTFVDLADNSPPYTEPGRRGAKLIYVDLTDPEMNRSNPKVGQLYQELSGDKGTKLATGTWYLHSIEQDEKEFFMYEYSSEDVVDRTPLEGLVVWRLVSSLKPEPAALKIKLIRRDSDSPSFIELTAWRRRYVDAKTGVIDLAYSPGELGQSLCSPWTHDFRDCACHYWASNHPDVVYGAIAADEEILPDGESANPIKANTPIDWLREDRSPSGTVAAMNTIDKNRPFQFDHFQINQRWEELNIVLQGHEIGETYQPQLREADPDPFSSPAELAAELREKLAPLEMALALEYLYARYSIKTPEEIEGEVWPTLKSDVTFMRHFLMMVAAGEMTHLRWVNQLLWGLYQAGLIEYYQPVLIPATEIPIGRHDKPRPRQLRRLTLETLDDFIKVEKPSGFIEGAYARVIATLRQPQYEHLNHLYELAIRIDTDGVQHFSQFHDIKKALKAYPKDRSDLYLRQVRVGRQDEAREALILYNDIILPQLYKAYSSFSDKHFHAGGEQTHSAREAMTRLNQIGDEMARQGIGIPFWEN